MAAASDSVVVEDAEAGVAPESVRPETPEAAAPPPPVDEGAEAAFLAEARDRGETFGRALAVEPAEETDSRNLPPLDELVQQIPAEVRETLDELFRAKFVTVRRVPSAALKK